MRVKRFVGDSVAETVSKIKQDLGQEAIILQTRQFKEGGFLGLFGQTKVEITAALDDQGITGYGEVLGGYGTAPAKPVMVRDDMEMRGDAADRSVQYDTLREDNDFQGERNSADGESENREPGNWGMTQDDCMAAEEWSQKDRYFEELGTGSRAVAETGSDAGSRKESAGHTAKADPMGTMVQAGMLGQAEMIRQTGAVDHSGLDVWASAVNGPSSQTDGRAERIARESTGNHRGSTGHRGTASHAGITKRGSAITKSSTDIGVSTGAKARPAGKARAGKTSTGSKAGASGQTDTAGQAVPGSQDDKLHTGYEASHSAQESRAPWGAADSGTEKLLRSIAQARVQNALEEAARTLVGDQQKNAVKTADTAEVAGSPDSIKKISERNSMAAIAAMEGDMKEIMTLINEIHHYLNAESGGAGFVPEPLQKWRDYLRRRGVSDTLCREMMFEAQIALKEEQWQDDRKVFAVLKNNILAKCSRTQALDIKALKEEGRPLIIALVGPTGVGKTTTIGKLSAGFSIVESRKVGLITADTYRVAAVEQLRTFGEILGIPVDVVMSASGLAESIAKQGDKDVILIDTAGRSPNHVMHMGELEELMNAAKPDLTLLVISATTNPEEQSLILEKFRPLSSHFILTKLDESRCEGAVLDLVTQTDLPLTYLTNGQNVPDDIDVATPEKLMGWILGQGAKGDAS